jgi:hypothetical protein
VVVAEVREILAVSKRATRKMDTERSNIKNLNEADVKEQYQAAITNKFAALENLKRIRGTATMHGTILDNT